MSVIRRTLEKELLRSAKEYPIVAILGPRQAGKTTLAKLAFRNKPYVSMENLDNRSYAKEDPNGFLNNYRKGAILDEVQRVPTLFSYLQTEVDRDPQPGRFILTGSHQFGLIESITQTLAGRIALLKLLPFSLLELKKAYCDENRLEEIMWRGGYPRIHDQKLRSATWLSNYIETYVERDVRQLKSIGDLGRFVTFLKLCAGRTGQIVNLSSLGNDCGINHNTAKAWLTLLEGSFILFTLAPFYRNFSKRLIKSPKIYFYDSGLLCRLLEIDAATTLRHHHLRGGIFEGFVLSEIMKNYFHRGTRPPLFFWRDKLGNEIDCIIDRSPFPMAIEIKSGETATNDYFKGIRYWQKVTPQKGAAYVIYGGDKNQTREQAAVLSWRSLAKARFMNEIVSRSDASDWEK